MSEEKKLVIKINYPNKGAEVHDKLTKSNEYITVWNTKRITTTALAVVGVLAVLGGYLGMNNGGDTDQQKAVTTKDSPVNNTPVTAAQTTVTTPAVSSSAVTVKQSSSEQQTKTSSLQGQVVRSILATSIRNKEPSGHVPSPLTIDRNGKRTLYYFTEITDMSGQQIYHEWLYKGKSLFKRPIKITGQRWRTATHKTIGATELGDWSVRLLDNNGDIMQQIDFKVVRSN